MPSRRTPLLAGGALLLAAGGGYMLTRGPDHDAATATLWSPRDPATFDGLVHCATLAANSHNAQAWRLRATADGVAIRPDMVLRFGYAPPMPRSLRRPVTAVIDA